MLVLSRRVGERLVIGNEVVVEVLSVSGGVVRIGVAAPRETSVHRHEVYEEIKAANRDASSGNAPGHGATTELVAALLRSQRAAT